VDRRKESSGRVARATLSLVKDAIRAAGLSCSACMIKGAQSWALCVAVNVQSCGLGAIREAVS
jgi:hypothetical protein